MSFKQIESKKISEIVQQQIEEMIRRGDVQPGEKLDSVVQLADQFKVSRSAVREALSALRAVGIITIKQGEGTFVNTYDFSNVLDPMKPERIISKKEMLELFEIRNIMEVGAAELAAEKRAPDHLKMMEDALASMKDASGEDNVGEAADVAFHLAIAEASQNNLMVDIMNQLSDTLRKTMFESRRVWLFSEKQTLERLYKEHEHIFLAIQDRNPSKARKAMLNHLMNVKETLIKGWEG
ncbi:transcriptional regulator, GntR family [Halobacillus karajensis]|uniref:L-lactate utilization operon repressor n=1 Tax=Halobacillus karajensis TaxID=195088 RepID=A0A059NZA5_9BACI|nr:FadR/GntR family transcriptional regulator [Halobacillus karajensis]CDQ18461.1 L-lactate utilization operon repressor [Halobacillus karajensis]CDQ23467.1 L-lactate utilization operon repressor [Halobacillus karajensis]CDQ26949.1 L-lactate utilization operon repressor [Halobacillus karajensis]SEH51159.1 transcriptional regulator, GntR family [Halobacillus karajensis]